MKLEKLDHVRLREQWPDESKDFTPWIASNEGLELLGKKLEMELELCDTEVSVGNYRADIVAKDTSNDQYVVVENQLSPTDHDHIGKLFTYAASLGATTLVWIAETMREEHRKAIDWFNETSTGVNFFGIEFELLRIRDSIAPYLNIVSKPNEWSRTVRAGRNMTTMDFLKLEFWTAFNEYIKSDGIRINQTKPTAKHWHNISIGNANIHLVLRLRTVQKDLSCEMYIATENAKEVFNNLNTHMEEINSKFGCKLDWMPLPKRKASRIVKRGTIDPNDKENWPDCFKWYSESVTQFREIMVPLL
ncbi:MAG: hypothetical protein CMI55_04435 [Parcubacteria group bacterium]|nr:hypothetical protein [Parcubacteria group bacterium]